MDSGSHRQLLRSRGHSAKQLCAERHRNRIRLQVRDESGFKDKIANLKGLDERLSKDLSSEDANVFVTNWDTARNEGALTYKDGAKYQLANAFMLAYDSAPHSDLRLQVE